MNVSRVLHLALRCVQFIISAIILGVISYQVHVLLNASSAVPTGFFFTLIICCCTIVSTIMAVVVPAPRLSMWYLCAWDILIALLFAVGFVWLVSQLSPFTCGWSDFNPFGKNSCGRIRAAMTFMLVEM
ncbi:hypothetical protein V1525DRAFT_348089 [Lipomyces kononenkoae]|uniref:Uncharacterized protein n=1 Tax=Lipomyces kononenkoae TaxID=34357 RepID=A0ACC3SV68_LIPKO